MTRATGMKKHGTNIFLIEQFLQIINNKRSGELDFYPAFTKDEFRTLNGWRDIVPEYAKDYILFNTYPLDREEYDDCKN